MKICIYVALALFFCSQANSQKIDNISSQKDIGGDRYFRFHYDNDFFTATDHYYTQGYTFEIILPLLRHNPVNTLLFTCGGKTRHGIAFEQTGFIPTDIKAAGILYGDRPYAATIALKSFTVTTDTISKSRLASSLTIGMIGPVALGDEIQTGIHKWIHDDLPQGWKYQIRNDLIVDYEVNYEKQLLRVKNFFNLTGTARARVGTLNTNASAGFGASAGILNSSFNNNRPTRKFNLYLYSNAFATTVGYDATLQGGLFTNSPYTISSRDIERVTFQNHFGLVLRYRGLYLEYSRALTTREFKGARSHKWGGFRIGFTI